MSEISLKILLRRNSLNTWHFSRLSHSSPVKMGGLDSVGSSEGVLIASVRYPSTLIRLVFRVTPGTGLNVTRNEPCSLSRSGRSELVDR